MPARKNSPPRLIRATRAFIPSPPERPSKPQKIKASGTRRTRVPWTPEDEEFLRKHYAHKGAVFCARSLGRTKASVNRRAEHLGVRSKLRRDWTPKEDAMLRLRYAKLTAPHLAKIMKRTEESIRGRVRKLGLSEPDSLPWTDDEITYLRKHYGRLTSVELSAEMGRTTDAVELKAGRLGLSRPKKRLTSAQKRYIVANLGKLEMTTLARKLNVSIRAIQGVAAKNGFRARPTSRAWTTADDEQLRELFPLLTNSEIAERLERTLLAVATRARSLGMFRVPRKRRKQQRPNHE